MNVLQNNFKTFFKANCMNAGNVFTPLLFSLLGQVRFCLLHQYA